MTPYEHARVLVGVMEWLGLIQAALGTMRSQFPIVVPTLCGLLWIVFRTLTGLGVDQFFFLAPARISTPSGSTTVIDNGPKIAIGGTITQVINIHPPAGAAGAATPIPPPAPTSPPSAVTETIVENGSVEHGVEGWGTGFYEGLFGLPGVPVLGFNGAKARWAPGKGNAHRGEWALRVEHDTPYAPHTFSSMSQRIKVTGQVHGPGPVMAGG